MSDIPPINRTPGAAGITPQPGPQRPAQERASSPATAPADRVDISEVGQRLSTLDVDPDIRLDKVLEIREAIANGSYESPAKIEYTISRLLEVLRSKQ